MNPDTQNLNPSPTIPEPIQTQPVTPQPEATNKPIKERFKEEILKFKQNKKLFYLITIAVGFLITLIVVGLIYSFIKSYSKTTRVEEENTPTDTKVVITSEEGLDEKMITVLDLESQINSLDLKQRKLSVPNTNFNLGFGATP